MDKDEKNKKQMEEGTRREVLRQRETKEGPADSGVGEFGPIAGIVIVLIFLTAGALYVFTQKLNHSQEPNNSAAEQLLSEEDSLINKIKSQSSSDKIPAIEEDLAETPIEKLDQGVKKIKTSLGLQERK